MKKLWGAVLLLSTALGLVTLPFAKSAAQAAPSKDIGPNTAARRLTVREKFSATYPEHWAPGAIQHLNAVELVSPVPTEESRVPPQARMVVTTEKHAYHGAAVIRLAEIAAGVKSESTFLAICGWPALQRRYRAPFPRLQRDSDDAKSDEKKDEVALWQTTAIAAGDTLVRFETVVTPGADEKFASDAERVGKSAVCPEAVPARTEFDLRELRAGTYRSHLKVSVGQLSENGPVIGSPRSALTAAGNGELEIGASSNGKVEIVASNTAVAVSNDAGATFPTSTLLGAFLTSNRGDPSVAVGRSGNIYVTLLDDPPGPAGGFSATACTITVTSTGNSGATFNLAGAAFSCPVSGKGVCAPDQEHVAADAINQARNGGGDQVYVAFRFFGGGASTCSAIKSGNAVPMIACSTNSGGSFGTALVIGQGDRPRVTVGPDGTVYVLYMDNNNIMLQKFTRCDSLNGMDYDGGPVTVKSIDLPGCPVAGLDRCLGVDLASPTLAVDDTNAQHLYVAFAQKSQRGGTGEDIIVMDSFDSGASWNNGIVINAVVVTRRFMPWICTSGGTAFVSWYDRRATTITGTSNDLTDFFLGGAMPAPGSTLASIAETKLTTTSDPQCALWGPTLFPGTFNVGPDDTNDSESCSVQPQNAGNCQKSITAGSSGTACDFSSTTCPSGESCKKSTGIPKYGDYNGIACAGGNIYTAWASSTPASTNVINGAPAIGIFNATIALPPGKLALKVNLTPVNSTARFNLSVDGNAVANNVGNGTVNVPGLTPQIHTVGVAAAGSTSLANFNLAFADDCSNAGTVPVFPGNNRTCEISLTSRSFNSCESECNQGLGQCMAATHDSADRRECIFDSRQCLKGCN